MPTASIACWMRAVLSPDSGARRATSGTSGMRCLAMAVARVAPVRHAVLLGVGGVGEPPGGVVTNALGLPLTGRRGRRVLFTEGRQLACPGWSARPTIAAARVGGSTRGRVTGVENPAARASPAARSATTGFLDRGVDLAPAGPARHATTAAPAGHRAGSAGGPADGLTLDPGARAGAAGRRHRHRHAERESAAATSSRSGGKHVRFRPGRRAVRRQQLRRDRAWGKRAVSS